MDLNTGKTIYKVTDINGNVPNNITSNTKLTISHTSYITFSDTIYPNTSKTILLKEDIFEMNQVVITATRTKKLLKNTPILTQVITAKDIETRGFKNVTEVLKAEVPSLEIQQHGYGTSLNLQGLKPTNILILIDGERIAGESRGNIDFSRLNTQEIDHIEIIKGASSALYGSQAMGAVINIISKNSKEKFYFSASAQYTSTSEKNYENLPSNDLYYTDKSNLDKLNLIQNYTFGINLGKFNSKTNFTRKTKDAYQLFGNNYIEGYYPELGITLNKPIEFYPTDVNGLKDHTISQTLGYSVNNKIDLKVNASFYQHDEYDFKYYDHKINQFDDFNYTFKANYNHNDKSNYTLSWHDDIYNKYEKTTNSTNKIYKHRATNPKLIGSYQLNKHQLTGGLEYLSESLLSDQLNESRDLQTKNISNAVIFVQNDFQISKKWNTVLGLRAEHHNTFGGNFSPKLSVMFKKYPFTIRTNLASGYRSPSIKELYSNWYLDEASFYIKGSEDIQPETNKYISTSFEYSKTKINTSISLYRNAFKDKIEGIFHDDSEGNLVYQYQNTESSTLIGLDYHLQYKPVKNWFVKLAYSYIKENKVKGDRISTISPHTGNLTLGYKYQKNDYSLNVSLNGKYIGSKDAYETDTIIHNGENIDATYIIHYDGYSIWQLSVYQKYKFVNVTFGANNLFNFTPNVYTFNTTISHGRNYFVGLKFNINNTFINKLKH